MPLWTIYHPPSTFTTPSSKSALAAAITKIYTSTRLPAFYVNVLFQPIDAESFYIGGVARPSPADPKNNPGPDSEKPFIRITIQNIARTLYVSSSLTPLLSLLSIIPSYIHQLIRFHQRPNDTVRDRFLTAIDAALKPHISDKGYDWEYSVIETRRDLWKIQGFVPPATGSEAEEVWRARNQAVEYEGSVRL